MLGAALMLTGVPWPVRAAALLAVAGHAIARRPRPLPRQIMLTADGDCAVPEWHSGSARLGARTLVCPYWVRLDCRVGAARRDLLLFSDQLSAQEWARLRALLARIRCD